MNKSIQENEGVERLLLRVPEAAQSLGIGKSLLYELIRDGVIPVVNVRGTVRISKEDLQAWVRHQSTSRQAVTA